MFWVCSAYMTSLSESIRECDSFVGSIFLTRSLLSHPSLMSYRIDDLVRDLQNTDSDYSNGQSRNLVQIRAKKYEKKSNNGNSFRASPLALTVRLCTTADSRCRRARSPRRGTLSSEWRPFLTGFLQRADLPRRPLPGPDPAPGVLRRAAHLMILCGKPPILTVGLFIFVISMRGYPFFFSFHAEKRDTVIEMQRTWINTWQNALHASAYAAEISVVLRYESFEILEKSFISYRENIFR